jgi:3'-phosphoadenosine 5'-phosphosulfate sulfotransferase (PAPS reductase)/FAD synthetase
MRRFNEFVRRIDVENIISFSGGKDSTAIYLKALEMGVKFRAVFCDTGHENEKTYDFVKNLHNVTGGPEIEIIRADFSDRFEKRRAYIAENWTRERVVKFKPNKQHPHGRTVVSPPVPQERIDRALEIMRPTSNPFLDLCILKGRFPSTKARFCTEELKSLPMIFQVMIPAVKKYGVGRVVSWQGVRREESATRAKLPEFNHGDPGVITWRAILNWTHEDVFSYHKKHNVKPNPLYFENMGRVGCFPCIMCKKGELAEIARRYPEHIARVYEWEKIVVDASRHGGAATFFPDSKTTKTEDHEKGQYLGIRDVVEWAKTGVGGRQYDLLDFDDGNAPPVCSSQYGLCE